VISCSLSINDYGTPFFAIRSLLDLLLSTSIGIKRRGLSKEKILKDLLGSIDHLYLLNQIMETHFDPTNEVLKYINKLVDMMSTQPAKANLLF